MKHQSFFIVGFLSLFLVASPARASRNADMFYDKQITHNRPWVPSDAHKGTDMFANIPVFLNSNADFFHRIKPITIYTRSDMLHIRNKQRISYASPIFTNDSWTN